MERTKMLRMGKVIDFKQIHQVRLEGYYRVLSETTNEEMKTIIQVMIREVESLLESIDWWFDLGKKEGEGNENNL